MTSQITRVTMIKLPSHAHIPIALSGFEIFTKTQNKDGKPYILSMEAGPANGHVREQGFNFVTKSVFANRGDMDFFEKECEGHEGFKMFLRERAPVGGLMVCWFDSGEGFSYVM